MWVFYITRHDQDLSTLLHLLRDLTRKHITRIRILLHSASFRPCACLPPSLGHRGLCCGLDLPQGIRKFTRLEKRAKVLVVSQSVLACVCVRGVVPRFCFAESMQQRRRWLSLQGMPVDYLDCAYNPNPNPCPKSSTIRTKVAVPVCCSCSCLHSRLRYAALC